MPAYNFMAEFANPIEDGNKRTTIRLPRKRPTRVGERLYFFIGQRTPACERLRPHHQDICKAVYPIIIENNGIILDGQALRPFEVDIAIKKDTAGLWSNKQFFDFFKKRYSPRFEGEMIAW